MVTHHTHVMKSKYFTGAKPTPFTPTLFKEGKYNAYDIVKLLCIRAIMHLCVLEMKTFLQEEMEKALNDTQRNVKLEGVMGVFRESLRDMEQLDREIEVIALDILPKEWSPQNDDLQRERGGWTPVKITGDWFAYTAAMKGDREVLSDEVLQKKSLTLQDLCQRIEPP